jgi:hypothetical protein
VLGQKLSKAQRPEDILTVDSRRHTSKDHRILVKALREKVQEESFETSKAKELKQFTIIDIWEDTLR